MSYSAAWTDSGFLLGCPHEHETIEEADSCIGCAGGYVVGVENGVTRSLTEAEEAEFQRVHYAHRVENPPPDTAPAEPEVSDSGYAVVTRIRVVDHWTWTTWMCFKTYAEATAHARAGNKVVRFRSPEWVALRQQAEVAPSSVADAALGNQPPRSDGETLLDFVLRFLSGYDVAQHAEPMSEVKPSVINTDMIDVILSRLSELEISELERMYAEDKHALVEAVGNRVSIFLKPQSRCP
jgi:hypothetical protein